MARRKRRCQRGAAPVSGRVSPVGSKAAPITRCVSRTGRARSGGRPNTPTSWRPSTRDTAVRAVVVHPLEVGVETVVDRADPLGVDRVVGAPGPGGSCAASAPCRASRRARRSGRRTGRVPGRPARCRPRRRAARERSAGRSRRAAHRAQALGGPGRVDGLQRDPQARAGVSAPRGRRRRCSSARGTPSGPGLPARRPSAHRTCSRRAQRQGQHGRAGQPRGHRVTAATVRSSGSRIRGPT